MNFLDKVNTEMNKTETENGATTLRTSNNPLIDFFALAGATRKNPELGLDLFLKAWAFNKLHTLRILFYLRDIREGQGERELFRNCLRYLSNNEPQVIQKIITHIPEYGRWDDLLVINTETILPIIKDQLREDLKTDNPSLLAKWLPSENTSSNKTKALAKTLIKALQTTSREYRKLLSTLRAKITLVEQKMSKKEWNTIDYDKVPSQASLKYRKAFSRNDEERYSKFLEQVDKGEKKINTATLYPYQVYKAADSVGAEQLWANLPDYTQGKNAIVVADVSGSMMGDPMAVSVSLALYFAEHNKGIFKDHFITFSSNPTLQKINGKTLKDKMNSIERAEWKFSTNIYKVFECVVNAGATQEEMPETIYIISDMEFDEAIENKTNFQAIKDLYTAKNLKLPNLVFWNVDARNKQVPVEFSQEGVTLISGLSPTAFKLAVENITPEQLVDNIANSARYAIIEL